MECQKINLLNNTPNQPSKFRSKNWVETNDGSHGTARTELAVKLNSKLQ